MLLPDPTFWFIRLLERIGLADRLRLPTQHALLARAADPSRSASSSSADRLVA